MVKLTLVYWSFHIIAKCSIQTKIDLREFSSLYGGFHQLAENWPPTAHQSGLAEIFK